MDDCEKEKVPIYGKELQQSLTPNPLFHLRAFRFVGGKPLLCLFNCVFVHVGANLESGPFDTALVCHHKFIQVYKKLLEILLFFVIDFYCFAIQRFFGDILNLLLS